MVKVKSLSTQLCESVSMTKSDQIPVHELRRLLHELKDLRPDICVRFRLIDETWQTDYARVVKLTYKGVTLADEANKQVFINDLNKVMQFELDQAFQQYSPHFHYSIDPLLAK